ncbi:MAG: hypothetical protein EXR62_16300 [Chloroflexi bacterium]|nr:hypothetical protein [Chloroflexota bacterium]
MQISIKQFISGFPWQRLRPWLAIAAAVGMLWLIASWGGNVATGPKLYLGLGVLITLFITFSLLIGWLFLSPIVEPKRIIARTRAPEIRQLVVFLVLLSGMLTSIGGVWDQGWHQIYGGFGKDFLWPPHMLLYTGLGMVAIFAGVGLGLLARGRGGIRARFRQEPAMGLLGLASAYMICSIPSDALWHEIYGVDITGWSLPHLLLAFCFTLMMMSALSLQLSLLSQQGWQGWRGWRWQEFLAVVPILWATLVLIQIGTADWEGIHRINLNPASAYEHAFWSRPEWLYPVVMIVIALFAGNFVLHALRRVGAATILGLIIVAYRLATVVLLRATSSSIDLSLTHHLLLLPPLVALDIWYALQILRAPGYGAKKPANLVIGNVWAGVVYLTCGLPLIATTLVYPRVNAATLPAMIVFGLMAGLVAGWIGASFGDWMGSIGRQTRQDVVVRPWVHWVALGVLVLALGVSVTYMLTARPPG